MVEINLLSWRAEKNKYERNRMRLIIAVAVITSLTLMIMIHLLLMKQIQRDDRLLQQLGMKFSGLNPSQRHQAASVDVLEDGFAAGKMMRLMLDEMAKSTASGVCFQQLSRDENGWHLSGRALSAASFTSAWRVLAAVNFFKNSVVQELKKDLAQDYFQFILQVPMMRSEREE